MVSWHSVRPPPPPKVDDDELTIVDCETGETQTARPRGKVCSGPDEVIDVVSGKPWNERTTLGAFIKQRREEREQYREERLQADTDTFKGQCGKLGDAMSAMGVEIGAALVHVPKAVDEEAITAVVLHDMAKAGQWPPRQPARPDRGAPLRMLFAHLGRLWVWRFRRWRWDRKLRRMGLGS